MALKEMATPNDLPSRVRVTGIVDHPTSMRQTSQEVFSLARRANRSGGAVIVNVVACPGEYYDPTGKHMGKTVLPADMPTGPRPILLQPNRFGVSITGFPEVVM